MPLHPDNNQKPMQSTLEPLSHTSQPDGWVGRRPSKKLLQTGLSAARNHIHMIAQNQVMASTAQCRLPHAACDIGNQIQAAA